MSRNSHSRQDLLIPLAEVFRRSGYDGATMTALSEATGLGKATLYHHFPGGKAEMVRALVEFAVADLDEKAFRHLARNVEWHQRLANFIDGFSEYVEDGACNCLLAVLVLGSEPPEIRKEIHAQVEHWLTGLAAAYAEGGYGEKGARRRASELLTTLHGSLLLARLTGSDRAFTQAAKRARRRLRRRAQARSHA